MSLNERCKEKNTRNKYMQKEEVQDKKGVEKNKFKKKISQRK